MFKKLDVEAVPKRVYELCRIVADGEIKEKEAYGKLFPAVFATPGTASYFPKVETAAIELGLVECSNNSVLKFVGNKNCLQSLSSFRQYCNSYIYKHHKNSYFCKLLSVILESNIDLIDKSVTDASTLNYVRSKLNDAPSSLSEDMLAIRFWLSFLGFGFVTSNRPQFFPNMYVALKDFIEMSELKKNVLIPVTEFLNEISLFFDLGFLQFKKTFSLNYAISAALWTLANNNEIELKKESDSKEKWSLFQTNDTTTIHEITHIVLKGGNVQ